MKIDSQFIEMTKMAILESQFSPIDDPDLYLSVEAYVASLDHAQSQESCTGSQSFIPKHFPVSKMPSYDQVKRRVSKLSPLVTWKHDMCINSCVGLTGTYENLESCPYSRGLEPRYDQDSRSPGRRRMSPGNSLRLSLLAHNSRLVGRAPGWSRGCFTGDRRPRWSKRAIGIPTTTSSAMVTFRAKRHCGCRRSLVAKTKNCWFCW